MVRTAPCHFSAPQKRRQLPIAALFSALEGCDSSRPPTVSAAQPADRS